jgi:hypothetical protein
MDAAIDFAAQQASALEHAQVFGDRREGHVKGRGEFTDSGFAMCQACENGAACRVSQGAEGGGKG